ncbi:C2 and GRAM domain-containing protein At5g50170-like [Neltuma alba]|uniref:C2 and GRAM domain-containing protein At5g50170-like n=1 Tax=Neltuma alba TaxID=207710 RepID=UPI0010A2F360|nr:C2 and GRAM domain-containing protein At5g50170-like [Prosopis alba]
MLRLYVCVLEAKDLPVKNSYVKLKLGKLKSRTRILRHTFNPVWYEEFVFRVHDAHEELIVSVFNHNDESVVANGCLDLLGEVRIPVGSVACEDKQTLPPTWFSLECPKSGKFVNIYCGKILLTTSLRGKGHASFLNHMHPPSSGIAMEDSKDLAGPHISSQDIFIPKVPRCKMPEGKQLMKVVAKYANRLDKVFTKKEESSKGDDSSEPSTSLSDNEEIVRDGPSPCSFEEAIALMESRDHKLEMPENLPAGILVDQIYLVSTYDLNALLFAPDSQFRRELAELQGTTNVQEGPWTWKSGDMSCLTRVVSYTQAPTKLVKAVKATEEQTYVRVNKEEYAILVGVSTPEVPYGNSFKIELLYKIMPEKEQSAEKCSHLVVSWGIVFMQSTMMKGMIEGGARQGLKESFDQFSNLLAQKFKKLDTSNLSNKQQVLSTMQTEDLSNWRLAIKYFWNFTVVSTIVMFSYVLVHIFRCGPNEIRGLEFKGLELPDSFGELITSGILVIQLQRVYNMLFHFFQARFQMGSDHGLKAHGDGWILTVALIEGVDLASLESSGLSDPYVVFTCNGKTRSSSVKLETRAPQWNEILEFDAMEEPPSVLNVEVFDFDGPFDQDVSLGHAEINFLKHTSTELADMWVSLEGKFAQSSQSKLHLRIFLDNNKGVETIRGYLMKKGKEVGKRLNLRSPQRNSTFQKLLGLPPEEFLISDFTCYLKRKLLLQGRLFLSARILGFYANFFGQKTKFFFLWEDIEDMQVLPPSLVSIGSPTLVIILRKDRGLDARHAAKSQDEEGRLRFHFQSFVSFGTASRTIKALWRTRTLDPDLKARLAEEQGDQEEGSVVPGDFGSMLDEEAKMSKIYSAEFPVKMRTVLELFDGGNLEHKIMQRTGCINYGTTSWESVKPDVFERRVSYKFSRQVSVFGGEVTCTQQKVPIENTEGWIVNEVMALHGVPFADHFRIHFRHQIQKSPADDCACKCEAYIKIIWFKSSKFQQRINQNITAKFTNRLKEIFEMLQKEVLFMSQKDSSIEALT